MVNERDLQWHLPELRKELKFKKPPKKSPVPTRWCPACRAYVPITEHKCVHKEWADDYKEKIRTKFDEGTYKFPEPPIKPRVADQEAMESLGEASWSEDKEQHKKNLRLARLLEK